MLAEKAKTFITMIKRSYVISEWVILSSLNEKKNQYYQNMVIILSQAIYAAIFTYFEYLSSNQYEIYIVAVRIKRTKMLLDFCLINSKLNRHIQ